MTLHSFILFYLFNTLGTLLSKKQFPPIHIGHVLQEQKAFDPLMFYVSIFLFAHPKIPLIHHLVTRLTFSHAHPQKIFHDSNSISLNIITILNR